MIIVIIVSIIVYLIALAIQISEYNDLVNKIVVPIFATVVAWVFTVCIIAMFSDMYIRNHKSEMIYYTSKVSRTNIRTLSDNTNNVTGTFELGFGSVNSESRFYFYGISSDSTFYLKSIKADGVKIIESNHVNPGVVRFEQHIDWSKSEISWWMFKLDDEREFYHIYVPKNTVMIKYNLDAQ